MKNRNAWVWGVLFAASLSSGGCVILQDGDGAGGDGAGNNVGGDGGGNTTPTGTDTGTGTATEVTCDANADDDTCTACLKSTCCAEYDACVNDDACLAKYTEWTECFFPTNAPEPSGYSLNYCKAAVGAEGNAAAFIDCFTSKCNVGDTPACGGEEVITWEGFAASFLEEYCSGCHFDGYEQTGLGPVDANGEPKPVANYSCDKEWLDGQWSQSPSARHPNGSFGNPDWFSTMAYGTVKADGPLIWCGVSPQLPPDCDPAKFPNAKRFPPSGNDPNGAHCWWMDDGTTCAQPDDIQRAKLVSWIFDGMVCNEGCDTTCPSP